VKLAALSTAEQNAHIGHCLRSDGTQDLKSDVGGQFAWQGQPPPSRQSLRCVARGPADTFAWPADTFAWLADAFAWLATT
jgi:hypothetical protein